MIKKIADFFYQKILNSRYGIRWFLAFVVTLATITLYQLDLFQRLELLTFDARFTLKNPKSDFSDIVFIDMAEDSIESIGRWPWPRKWHAALVKVLSEYSPKAIVFDVIFSEPQDAVDDTALEEAIKTARVVYLPLSYDIAPGDGRGIYDGEGVASVLEAIPALRRWIKGEGHINAIADPDGVFRRIYPLITYKGRKTYQLGFKVGCDMQGLSDNDISFYPDEHLMLLKKPDGSLIRVPLDEGNRLIVNWKGRWGKEFKHYSYIDVIRSYALMKEGKKSIVDLNVFRDKVCIIGLTALGLTDIKPVPIENAYPAVGVNAMVAYSIMKGDFIYPTKWEFDMALIFLIALFFTLYLSGLRPLSGMIAAIAGIVAYFSLSAAAFIFFNTSVITFYPMLAITLSYGVTAAYTQILQSIERTRLFKQATQDGLTRLYNVRHFNLLIEAELRSASMNRQKKVSIMMFDLDNFKKLNDTYGHQAGDVLLKEFAKIMQAKCRQTDIVARYGGEEFIIMLIGAGQKEAVDVAEKIRAALEAKKFKFGNDTYATTASIGVVEYSTEKTREELVEKADKALYKAKHEGKNRACVYSPDIVVEPKAPA